MKLQDLAIQLENFAEEALIEVETAGEKIIQEVKPVVESAFAQLVDEFGKLAVSTVTNLMTAAGASLSGGEKLNLTATTIVQAAEAAGKQILAEHVTALAQLAYTAVMGKAQPAQ